MEDLEMKKILEQRKRDKEEDRVARERVRKQIEADKAARRAKASAESGEIPAPIVSPIQTAPSAQKRDYTETKLQVNKYYHSHWKTYIYIFIFILYFL